MFENLSERPIAEVQNLQADQWDKENLLEKCVTTREGRPSFLFYEGPPTANGSPGIHHVIARTLKDSVLRHKTMQGYAVKRKAGWDTHGLPVEIEVEKQLKNEWETGYRKIRYPRIQSEMPRIRIHLRKAVAGNEQAHGLSHRYG